MVEKNHGNQRKKPLVFLKYLLSDWQNISKTSWLFWFLLTPTDVLCPQLAFEEIEVLQVLGSSKANPWSPVFWMLVHSAFC